MTQSTLHGKTALITGSTSGIGLAIAQRFAVAGAKVILHGIEPEDQLTATLSDFRNNFDPKTPYYCADIAQPSEIESLYQKIHASDTTVDILVNNAGIQYVCPIEDYPTETWNKIIAVNLSAAFHLIRLILPDMKTKSWGRIINIASAHALVASPYKSAYVTAKHGLLGLTKTVALEAAEHAITCNAICPGYVKTPLVENQIADTAKARGISPQEVIETVMLTAQPTGEFVSMDDVAEYAHFLCLPSAQNITGSAQSIDGGWIAK